MTDFATEMRRQLVAKYLLASLFAVLTGAIFFVFGLDISADQGRVSLFYVAPVIMASTLAFDIPTIHILFRPILRFLQDPENAPATLREHALARALNMPFLTFQRIMGIHLPAAIIPGLVLTFLGKSLFGVPFQHWQLILFVALTFVVASCHALLEYLLIQKPCRQIVDTMSPYIPTEMRSRLYGVVRLPSQKQMLIAVLTLVVVPQVVIGATAVYRLYDIKSTVPGFPEHELVGFFLWILFAVVVISGFSLWISRLVAQGFSSPLAELGRAVSKVEKGLLHDRLEDLRSDEFSELYRGFNRMLAGLEEREGLREKFGRYLPPVLVSKMLREEVKLGGALMQVSVLFCDIRNFAVLLESFEAPQVMDMLNAFYTEVHQAIWDSGGVVDKHVGDTLMAVYGSQMPDSNHSRSALDGALGILRVLERFNQAQATQGLPAFQVGIGVASGPAMVGNIGSPQRMEFTVVGAPVYRAERLKSLARMLDNTILVSEECWQKTKHAYQYSDLGALPLCGEVDATHVYMLDLG